MTQQTIDPALHHHKSGNRVPEDGKLSETLFSLFRVLAGNIQDEKVCEQIDDLENEFISRLKGINMSRDFSARLVIRYEDGVKDVSTIKVDTIHQTLSASLIPGKALKSFEVNPLNNYCVVRIRALLSGENNPSVMELNPLWKNSFHSEGLFLYFRTVCPQVMFKPEGSTLTFNKVIIHLKYMATGQNALYIISTLLSDQLSRDQAVLKTRKDQSKQIKNSLTWKTGRIILWPLIFFSESFKPIVRSFRRK